MEKLSPTFIKAAEVWLLDSSGTLLEFGSGFFGSARRFAAMTRQMCFGCGEGLPGRAWEEGQPLVLRDFTPTNFRRKTAALDAGLGCAVAVPLFMHGALTSVLVLFFGHEVNAQSALELWRKDTDSGVMKLVDGDFAQQLKDAPSRPVVDVMPGAELPALASQREQAVFMERFSGGANDSAGESAAEWTRALAIPVSTKEHLAFVINLIASTALPIARRVERWVPVEGDSMLRRDYAFSEMHGRVSETPAFLPKYDTSGSIAKAFNTYIPIINELPASEYGAPAAAAATIGSKALLAIPLISNNRVVEVVALYL